MEGIGRHLSRGGNRRGGLGRWRTCLLICLAKLLEEGVFALAAHRRRWSSPGRYVLTAADGRRWSSAHCHRKTSYSGLCWTFIARQDLTAGGCSLLGSDLLRTLLIRRRLVAQALELQLKLPLPLFGCFDLSSVGCQFRFFLFCFFFCGLFPSFFFLLFNLTLLHLFF